VGVRSVQRLAMPVSEPTFTFGIEEEYHLVDLASRDLAPAPAALMSACETALQARVSPEFLRSQLEIGTTPHSSFSSARQELAHLRSTVCRLAGDHGLAPMAAATHPFARAEGLEQTDKERYRHLAQDLAGVGRRLSVCGMHVHVGIADQELRIDIMNQVRYFLPHLLVLSTSSPFWEGHDTGLKSYRLAVMRGMPRTGLPGRLSGWDEYTETVDVLIRARVIEDASKIWWDVRPSVRFPTLEMRVTDVATRISDAVAIAALYTCICRMLWRLRRSNQSWRTYPVFLLEENRWRAQRYGSGGSLFDFGKGELVAFPDLLDELLVLVEEDAEALGCRVELAHTRAIARSGTSADRQLAVFAAARATGEDHAAAQRLVVDSLIAETAVTD
jgi:glutamate---cysteine ligase / carboxylate-amine ligase